MKGVDGIGLQRVGALMGLRNVRATLIDATWTDRLGLFGLCVFCIAYMGSKALANIALAILFAAFVRHAIRFRQEWMKDPMMRLAAAWLVYLSVLAIWRKVSGTGGSLLQAENLCLVFVPAFAWATRGRLERTFLALGLALVGVALRLGADIDPAVRWGFDYTQTDDLLGINRNISGPILNTAIVGVFLIVIACLQDLLRDRDHGRRRWALMIAAGASAILAVLLVPWAMSPSRTLWLSLFLAMSVVVVRLFRLSLRAAIVGFVVLFVLCVVIVMRSDWFASVLTKDAETWRLLLQGHWTSIPDTSTGLRAQMIAMGLQRFLDSPLFGAVNSGSEILKQHPQFLLAGGAQLHNGYLEVLVRMGIVGIGFFTSALFLAGRAVVQARRRGSLPPLLGELLLAALLLFLAANTTTAVIFFQHGWQFLVFFAGLAYGFGLNAHQAGSRCES